MHAHFLVITTIILCLTTLSVRSHKCIHDQLLAQQTLEEKQQASKLNYHLDHPFVTRRRDSLSTQWGPLRVHFDTSSLTSSTQDTFIKNNVIPKSRERLQDMLQVFQVQGNLQLERRCASWWTVGGKKYDPNRCAQYSSAKCNFYTIPDNYFKKQDIYSSTDSDTIIGQTAGGDGVANTDLIIFVTHQNTNCGTGTIAYATNCFRDQFDRPIAGIANFCMVDTSSEEGLIDTFIHEIFHVLGFSANDFAFYRNENGEPYTNRNSEGLPPTDSTNSYYVPSTNTVQSFSERGSPSNSIKKLVLPKALNLARKYLNCSSLNGIELEEAGSSGSAGSHLERRVFNHENMISVDAKHLVISQISLAVLEASSWYRANYSSRFVEHLSWGYQMGCGFAYESKCIGGSKSSPVSSFSRHFCVVDNEVRCTVNLQAKGSCSISTHDSIPSYQQYFSNANLGGPSSLDYCPQYSASTECSDTSETASSLRGESYSSSSKCFHNTLSTGSSQSVEAASCYPISCNVTSGVINSIEITVASQKVVCLSGEEGQRKSVSGYSGTIECPVYYHAACPEFYNSFKRNDTSTQEGCRFVCENGGTCQNNKCVCTEGWSGESCSERSDSGTSALTSSLWLTGGLVLVVALLN